MFDHLTLRRHRLSALSNGVLIGMGLVFTMSLGLSSVIPVIPLVGIVAGVGLEVWQRSRIPKNPT